MAPDDAPFSPELSGMKIIPLRHKLTDLYRPIDINIVGHCHSHN